MSALEPALATHGLGWLILAASLAGLVRGFTGFGTALVFMPVAGAVVPPFWALVVLVVMDSIGPLPNLPRALRDGSPREVARVMGGVIVGLPMGVWLLDRLPVTVFQWAVSVLALALVAILLCGWRYRGPHGPVVSGAAGWVSGFLGGSTGLGGPPVVLYYMASGLPAVQLRGNFLLFFVGINAAFLVTLAVMGHLALAAAVLGLVLVPPFLLANILGAAMFRPEREALYRGVAFGIITLAALSGMPVWR